MRVSKTREGPITALLRIRGQGPEAALLCESWEQAIRKARRMLPHFEQRSPWLYFDSRQRKLYVLLDPETEPSLAPARHSPINSESSDEKELVGEYSRKKPQAAPDSKKLI